MMEPKPPPFRDAADLVQHAGLVLGLAAREDHDAPPVEGALHHVAHALGQRADRDLVLLVDLLRGLELDVLGGRLHLDEVRAELRRDLRGVGHDVDRRLALLRDARAARVGPDHDREAHGLGFLGELADLLVHLVSHARGRVDGEADRGAAEAQRVAHAAGDRRARVVPAVEGVRVVQLEDGRNAARELRGAGLEEAEGRGVGVAAGVDRELEVVARVVAGGVRREAARRAVLEALVHRQDHELAGAAQPAVVQQPGQVVEGPRVVRAVPGEDLPHPLAIGRHLAHLRPSRPTWVSGRAPR